MSIPIATRRVRTAAVEATRVVIYARISDDKALIKAGMAGRNVGEQVDDAITYAARVLCIDPSTAAEAGTLTGRGKAARWVANPAAAEALMIVYRENDRSAYKRQTVHAVINGVEQDAERVVRPVWDAMMTDVRTGRVRAVIGLDMDRLLRDPIDLEDAMSTAGRYGTDWHGVTSGMFDFRSSGGQMNARVMAAAKRLQSNDTARRVTRAHRRRTEAGRPNWTNRPFGHDIARKGTPNAGAATLNLAEADAIGDAAKAIIEQDATLYTLVKAWNAAGILTTRGKWWSIATLGAMLPQPRVAGIMTVDGIERPDIPAAFPAILPADRWRAMCARLDARGRESRVEGKRAVNLMSGIAECYACPETARVSRRSGVRCYVCMAGHVRANADTVEAYVASAIIGMRRVGKLGGQGRYIPLVSQDSVDTAPLHAERDRLTAEIATLADMLRAGTASVVALAPVMTDMQRQLDDVTGRLASANATAERAAWRDALLSEWASLTMDGRRTVDHVAGSRWVMAGRLLAAPFLAVRVARSR